MNKLEVHHIFPKSRLNKAKEYNFRKPEVNALANFCFLTKDTNLKISNQLPEEYFPEIESAHPVALGSQWIPDDPDLWKLENYRDFVEARKELLATELNKRMENLLHGDTRWLEGDVATTVDTPSVIGGVSSEEEQLELEKLNEWISDVGLPEGEMGYDHSDEESGRQIAVFDLAWPDGLQTELSQPVVVLLNEEASTIAEAFDGYVSRSASII